MTGEEVRPALEALALANARAACDRACDELAGALALDPLPVVVRHALASALRSVAEAEGTIGAIDGEPRCDRFGTHAEPASARGAGDTTRSTPPA